MSHVSARHALVLLGACTLAASCRHDPAAATPGDGRTEAEAALPDRCASDGDCSPQLAICPHPSMENLAVCARPTMPDGSSQPGTCSGEVRCGANSRAECEALARRCVGSPGEARWDETLPRFRSEGDPPGQCYVRCARWPG